MADLAELNHYTQRLERNPDWQALRAAIEKQRASLVAKLVNQAFDHAHESAVHALRGEIRALSAVLDKPRLEAARATQEHDE